MSDYNTPEQTLEIMLKTVKKPELFESILSWHNNTRISIKDIPLVEEKIKKFFELPLSMDEAINTYETIRKINGKFDLNIALFLEEKTLRDLGNQALDEIYRVIDEVKEQSLQLKNNRTSRMPENIFEKISILSKHNTGLIYEDSKVQEIYSKIITIPFRSTRTVERANPSNSYEVFRDEYDFGETKYFMKEMERLTSHPLKKETVIKNLPTRLAQDYAFRAENTYFCNKLQKYLLKMFEFTKEERSEIMRATFKLLNTETSYSEPTLLKNTKRLTKKEYTNINQEIQNTYEKYSKELIKNFQNSNLRPLYLDILTDIYDITEIPFSQGTQDFLKKKHEREFSDAI